MDPQVHHNKILKIIINQTCFDSSFLCAAGFPLGPRKMPPLGEERRPVIQTQRLGLERGLQGCSKAAFIDAANIMLARIPVADIEAELRHDRNRGTDVPGAVILVDV